MFDDQLFLWIVGHQGVHTVVITSMSEPKKSLNFNKSGMRVQ